MHPIVQWLADHQITSVRTAGAPSKTAESPYKVLVRKKVPWSDKEEDVPVNDPASEGWTFTLTKPAKEPKPDPKKLMPEVKKKMPKTTSVRIQFFTPPGSNKVPGVEDVVSELQDEFDKALQRHEAGQADAAMPQPYLGSMLILQTWLTEPMFRELMDIR